MIGNYQATLVQVTNIAPSVQNDQIKSLFAFIGEIEQIIMYPIELVFNVLNDSYYHSIC